MRRIEVGGWMGGMSGRLEEGKKKAGRDAEDSGAVESCASEDGRSRRKLQK